jgi:hypothetical protein
MKILADRMTVVGSAVGDVGLIAYILANLDEEYNSPNVCYNMQGGNMSLLDSLCSLPQH